VVVAVIVAVLLVLAGTGVLHLLPAASSSTVYGTPMPYSQFVTPATTALGSALYGPWQPVAVLGLATGTSAGGSNDAQGFGGGGCNPVWAAAGSIELPATGSGHPAGEVAAWFMLSLDAGSDVLFTLVTNISGDLQGENLEIVHEGCLAGFSSFHILPSLGTLVDSTVAAAAADAEEGSAFLADYPGATQELEVLSLNAGNATWAIGYTTCAFFATGGTGTEFIAAVNGTTGAFQNQAWQTVAC
jgi:hypothetical protein